jgi:hypothetical protein
MEEEIKNQKPEVQTNEASNPPVPQPGPQQPAGQPGEVGQAGGIQQPSAEPIKKTDENQTSE